jgi:hypothetical protein
VPRWHRAEEHRGTGRDCEGEHHNRRIKASLVQHRNAGRRAERGNHAGRPGRKHQPAQAAEQPEQQAFDQQTTDQAAAPGAYGNAHGHLTAAANCTDQDEAGDVHADDQQQQADGAEEDEQRLAHVADDGVTQAVDRRR